MLCKAATEMTNQWNIVNAAFSDRIREYIKARTDLETHLAKVRTYHGSFSHYWLFLMIMLMVMTTMIVIITTISIARDFRECKLAKAENFSGPVRKLISLYMTASMKHRKFKN